MMKQISLWKATRVLLPSVLATLLLVGPVLFAPTPGSDGVAWAGKFDRGGGGGGKNARQGGGGKKGQATKIKD